MVWPGVPCLFTEEQEAEPHEVGTQGQNKGDYMEMIRQLYAVEELQGYTEEFQHRCFNIKELRYAA